MEPSFKQVFLDRFQALSPPQRLPLGIPIKIAMIEKQKAREGRWEEVKSPAPFLCSSHRLQRAFFFFLPSLPTKQTGLCGGESFQGIQKYFLREGKKIE